MSLTDTGALKLKFERLEAQNERKLLTDEDIGVVHFNKNSLLESPESDPLITRAQIEALDRILYDNREKYSGNTDYSRFYDREYPELDVDFIDKGKIVVRVMDKHNFYETEVLPDEYLNSAPVGLLTKLWIHISRTVKE